MKSGGRGPALELLCIGCGPFNEAAFLPRVLIGGEGWGMGDRPSPPAERTRQGPTLCQGTERLALDHDPWAWLSYHYFSSNNFLFFSNSWYTTLHWLS